MATRDRQLRVAVAQRPRVQQVRELGRAVAREGVGVCGSCWVQDQAAGEGGEVVAYGAEVDDADVRGGLGGLEQGGEEELGQERVAHVVGAELDVVVLRGEGEGDGHYSWLD